MRLLSLALLIVAGIAAATTPSSTARALEPGWHAGTATSYSCNEPHPPVGCSNGIGHTACRTLLEDRKFTVAVHYGIGLDKGTGSAPRPACGTKIVIEARGPTGRLRYRTATVNDRTLSRFDLELSYWLSRALGASDRAWDAPRSIRWRLAK